MDKQKLIASLKESGFSEKILKAFQKVKREDFVPEPLKSLAYANEALPLGFGSTISQPYTIAFMLDLLEIKNQLQILEIGSGSGYVLALLSELSPDSKIFGLEITETIALQAEANLKNHKNIKVSADNGWFGLPKQAPFDRILISAAAEKLPEHLYSQLSDQGILVCPVINSIWQVKKINDKITATEFPGFVFVPLIKP